MASQRQEAARVARSLTTLSPLITYVCPDCDAVHLGSELVSMSDPVDHWIYDQSSPFSPKRGTNQYAEVSDVQTHLALPPNAGITAERLLASRELAKVPPLSEVYTKCAMVHNQTYPHTAPTYVWGAGNAATAKVAIVGEGPGPVENQFGIPFIGPAGQTLSGVLEGAGLNRENDILLLNSVNTMPLPPPNTRKTFGKPATLHMLQERPRLIEVIRLLSTQRATPLKALVCVGKYSWLQLTDPGRLLAAAKKQEEINVNSFYISRHLGWHLGAIPEFPDLPVMLNYHPSFILRKWDRSKGQGAQDPCIRRYLDMFIQLKEKISG